MQVHSVGSRGPSSSQLMCLKGNYHWCCFFPFRSEIRPCCRVLQQPRMTSPWSYPNCTWRPFQRKGWRAGQRLQHFRLESKIILFLVFIFCNWEQEARLLWMCGEENTSKLLFIVNSWKRSNFDIYCWMWYFRDDVNF